MLVYLLYISVNELEKTSERAVAGIGKTASDGWQLAAIVRTAIYFRLPIISALRATLAAADNQPAPAPLAVDVCEDKKIEVRSACDIACCIGWADVLAEYPQHRICLNKHGAPLLLIAATLYAATNLNRAFALQWTNEAKQQHTTCSAQAITARGDVKINSEPIGAIECSAINESGIAPQILYTNDSAAIYESGIKLTETETQHWQHLQTYAARRLVPDSAQSQRGAGADD